jgi:hypothetical protein
MTLRANNYKPDTNVIIGATTSRTNRKMFICSPFFNVACYITMAVQWSFIKVLLINITFRLSMLNQDRFISNSNRFTAILALILISTVFIL